LQATEGVDILVAGADTTAYTLTVALFCILKNPSIQRKLEDALSTVIKSPDAIPPVLELEKIEYLVSCRPR